MEWAAGALGLTLLEVEAPDELCVEEPCELCVEELCELCELCEEWEL